MNLELKKGTVVDYAITGGSALVGGTVSKGVMGLASEGLKKPLVRGAFSILALLGAGSIQGKDTGAKIARGGLLGVSVEQGIGAISSLVSPSVKTNPTTKAEKFIAAIAKGSEANGMNSSDEFFQPALEISHDAWSDENSLNNSKYNQVDSIALGKFKA